MDGVVWWGSHVAQLFSQGAILKRRTGERRCEASVRSACIIFGVWPPAATLAHALMLGV